MLTAFRPVWPLVAVSTLAIPAARAQSCITQPVAPLPSDFYRVALDDNTLVIAALSSTSSAYVYERPNPEADWVLDTILTPSEQRGAYGASVALSGGLIAVSAPALLPNDAGGTFVYRRDASTGAWSEEAILPDAGHSQTAVAAEGDTIVIGRVPTSSNQGSATIWRRPGVGPWQLDQTLFAPFATAVSGFGVDVEISGDRIAVSSEMVPQLGSGAVFIYSDQGMNWTLEATLQASNAAPIDNFGKSISLQGDRLVVGAWRSTVRDTGALFAFESPAPGVWNETALVVPAAALPYDFVGWSVALDGDRVVCSATGTDDGPLNSGVLYAFEWGAWNDPVLIRDAAPSLQGQYGALVDVSGDSAVSMRWITDGTPESVQTFDLTTCPLIGSSYCGPATANSSGQSAQIFASGSDDANVGDVTLHARDMAQFQFGYFLVSRDAGSFQPPGSAGVICLSGAIGRFNSPTQIRFTDAAGAFSLEVDTSALPLSPAAVVQPGDTWRFQAWFRDNVPGPTSNFSDGVLIDFQ